jgi:hypothetical protein
MSTVKVFSKRLSVTGCDWGQERKRFRYGCMGNGNPWKSKYGGRSTTGIRMEWKNFGLGCGGGRDKDLAGWIRYHYKSCDVKEGGGFP